MTKKVVAVGSSTFPIEPGIGKEIVDIMLDQGEDAVFLTRGSGNVDTFIKHAAIIIGRRCFTYPSQGGADNFLRDIEMVKDGDSVIAFLDPDTLKDPNTGTAHVLEAALRAEKPCRAYTVVDGTLVYAGENP